MQTLSILSRSQHRNGGRRIPPATPNAVPHSTRGRQVIARHWQPAPERSVDRAMAVRAVLAIVPIAAAALLCWMLLSWPWVAGVAALLGLAIYAYVSR